MGITIVLDAGHGGSDPGAVNGSRYESSDVLRLAREVGSILSGWGLEVIMTREADSTVTLGSRTLLANGSGADLFVSLHRNSYTDPAANGTEIWVDTAAGAAETAMAAAVLEELARVGVQSNRGVKKGNYHVLRETAMPAMLVELGFVSNEEDNRLFDRRFERYAQAIARGVCGALGIAAPPQGENAGEEAPKYKVQVGAFRREENARAFLRQVREMGLEAFLIREEDQAG